MTFFLFCFLFHYTYDKFLVWIFDFCITSVLQKERIFIDTIRGSASKTTSKHIQGSCFRKTEFTKGPTSFGVKPDLNARFVPKELIMKGPDFYQMRDLRWFVWQGAMGQSKGL